PIAINSPSAPRPPLASSTLLVMEFPMKTAPHSPQWAAAFPFHHTPPIASRLKPYCLFKPRPRGSHPTAKLAISATLPSKAERNPPWLNQNPQENPPVPRLQDLESSISSLR